MASCDSTTVLSTDPGIRVSRHSFHRSGTPLPSLLGTGGQASSRLNTAMANSKRIHIRAAGAPTGRDIEVEPGDTLQSLLIALGQDASEMSVRRTSTGEPLSPLDDLYEILHPGESLTIAPLMDAGLQWD